MRKLFGVLLLVMSFAPIVLADTEDTAVFQVRMLPSNEVPAIQAPGVEGSARITVRATRDPRGTVTAATVIFEVDYNLGTQSTITGLHIHNSPVGVNGAVVIDSGLSGTNTVQGTTGRIVRVVTVPDNRLSFVSGVLSTP